MDCGRTWRGGRWDYAGAVAFLLSRGYRLRDDRRWASPSVRHSPDFHEADALLYLIDEHGFGGIADLAGRKPR